MSKATRLALWIELGRAIVLSGKTPVLFETLPQDPPWEAKT